MFEPYKQLLTIGITAFNEEKYIAQTLESCANQAGRIVICDNASTDGTERICREFAAKYSNIDYIRLEKDLGKDYGFNFVLKEAKTKYFMWCGPHDFLDENYTINMISMLENSDAIGCYPAGRTITPDGKNMGIYEYWFSNQLTSDSAVERVYSMIRHLHNISIIFGIYRTEIAQKYPMPPGIGGDHIVMCNFAREGRLIYCPKSVFNFRETKLHMTPDELVQSWKDAPATSSIGSTYQFMCDEQLKILKSCKTRNLSDFIKKIYLVKKARKKLESRFLGRNFR